MERFFLNLTDPQSELGEALSSTAFTHPALLEMTMRQALSLAIDRGLLVEIGYGVAGRVTCNVLPAPASYASTVNECCMLQNSNMARALFDAAGRLDNNGDGVQEKDGVELRFL
ncbi:MAG: hypothetical protein AAGA97_04530 [Pseudomonadota bacterium]